jgi:NAD(P)-dependent dehydrogenase (short-subunit alcohol dehydrogenase family)
MPSLSDLFSLHGRVAVVTGGTGVLGSAMAHGLVDAGARVAILGRSSERGERVVHELQQAGGQAMLCLADVLDTGQLEAAREVILRTWERIDILVNAAGGGVPGSSVTEQTSFFDLPRDALEAVIDLNLLGTILPSQVFGAPMAERKEGSIVNISSMTAQRPLTRLIGYGIGKAGVENFTRWLAVEVARRYGPGLRVNALAPGFFPALQNRALLVRDDATLTERGQTIIDHTPAGRFGEPEELIGALIWLCSPSARFVTGTVINIDGGFSAYGGV